VTLADLIYYWLRGAELQGNFTDTHGLLLLLSRIRARAS
jgi:hypothetical protein